MAKFSKTTHCRFCNLKLNIFNFLSDDELQEINRHRYEVVFNKGETIFKQGGPLTHVACLTSGLAKVYIEDPQKKNIILKILRPTEMVCGPGLQVDFRHHFTVSALEESTACFIDIHVFTKMLEQNSQFSLEFIAVLNRQSIYYFEKLMALTHKQMHGRIADTMIYLSKEVYKNKVFNLNLSRQDIAELSGLTKESCIRILKEFKDEGILTIEGDRIEILREETLQKISITG
ncbi:MAG: Crp/Fnr family transcriptional regulator [Bacteroidales bacterium]|nr:Crp/Fnr family transcriptional regulator [Bacteroidales bacterium]